MYYQNRNAGYNMNAGIQSAPKFGAFQPKYSAPRKPEYPTGSLFNNSSNSGSVKKNMKYHSGGSAIFDPRTKRNEKPSFAPSVASSVRDTQEN